MAKLAHVVLFGLALSLAVLSAPAPAQTIQTVVGGGFRSPNASFNPNVSFSIGLAQAVAVDSSGIYVADATHGSVYSVDAAGVSVIAGNGTPGNTPVLQNPTGLAVDGKGNLFIADQAAGIVYEVATTGGAVQVVAGCGSINSPLCPIQPNYGDGGKATSAFTQPAAVFVDSSGNIFIADIRTCRIREVTATNGKITTVAGSTCPTNPLTNPMDGPATTAQLNAPQGVVVDSSGDIFIADTGDALVREVCASGGLPCNQAGNIHTIAGGGPQDVINATDMFGAMVPATNVGLYSPQGLALDLSGNLYIADFQHDLVLIVNIGSSLTDFVEGEPIMPWDIQIVAGTGFPPENVFANSRSFNGPAGLAFFDNNLYIADSSDHTIQLLDLLGHSRLLLPYVGNQTEDSFVGGKDPLSVQLANPLAVSEDATANIYLSETSAANLNSVIFPGQTTSRVLEAKPSLSAIKLIDEPSLPPTGLFLDNSDDVFIADGGLDEISEAYGLVPVAVNVTLPSDVALYVVGLTGNSSNNLYLSGSTEYGYSAGNNYIVGYPAASLLVNPGALTSGGYPYNPTTMLGDGGPAQSALFGNITGLCTDSAGNLYITDGVTRLVRVINTGKQATTIAGVTIPGNNTIETIAGGGFPLPVDPTSHFDYSAEQIGDGGPATKALLSPQACFVDNIGNVFLADGYNDRIRQIDSKGEVSTIAGSQYAGFSGDGNAAKDASLNFPNAIWGDQAGNLLISDSGNHRIREITGILPVPNASISCPNCSLTNATGSNQTATITLTNTGGAPLVMSTGPSLMDSTDFKISASTCQVGPPGLEPHSACTVSVTAVGTKDASTNVLFHDNASLNNASENSEVTAAPDLNQSGQWSGYVQTFQNVSIKYLSAMLGFDPLSLVFTAENVVQPIKVQNLGSVPLTFSVKVPPPFIQTNSSSDSCGLAATLSANGDHCNIYVVFKGPAPSGGVGGEPAVAISDNTAVGKESIPLLGYALVPSGSTSFNISSSAAQPVTATFGLVGIPSSASVSPLCSVTPAGLDVTCSYNATNQTITATASIPSCVQTSKANVPAHGGGARYVSLGLVGVALLLPWGRSRRKRLLSLMGVAVLSCVVGGVSACSSTNQFSSSCVASVPSGTTFQLDVTANAGTAGQFPSLTLTTPDVISVTK